MRAVDAGSGPAILAAHDSYTFGEEVADYDTWPAQLERLSGGRGLNGGVSERRRAFAHVLPVQLNERGKPKFADAHEEALNDVSDMLFYQPSAILNE